MNHTENQNNHSTNNKENPMEHTEENTNYPTKENNPTTPGEPAMLPQNIAPHEYNFYYTGGSNHNQITIDPLDETLPKTHTEDNGPNETTPTTADSNEVTSFRMYMNREVFWQHAKRAGITPEEFDDEREGVKARVRNAVKAQLYKDVGATPPLSNEERRELWKLDRLRLQHPEGNFKSKKYPDLNARRNIK